MSLNTMPPPRPAHEDSEDNSDDDDFAPEPASKQPKKRATKDDSSDDEDSDAADQSAATAEKGDSIDADEVAAMKREREQMIEEAGGEHRLGKRRRAAALESDTATAQTQTGDAESAKKEAEEAWKAMQTAPETESKDAPTAEDMISVPHTYKFAGEMHTSTKMLPRSHPEAVAYLSTQTAAASPAAAQKPIPRPGPRKKKSSLASLAAAAATAKPTRLNTLEKSKLDWESFKQTPSGGLTQQERDEIEQQTKGGASGLGNMKGYLERQDFLDRVRGRTGQPDK